MPSPYQALFDEIQQGQLVLAPNHRSSVQLLEHYGQWLLKQKSSSVCRSPNVFAIDIWIKNQWNFLQTQSVSSSELSVLSPTEELYLWRNIISKHSDELPYINTEGTARKIQEAYQLLRLWKISDIELARFSNPIVINDKLLDDNVLFLRWMKEFSDLCSKQSLCTQAESLQNLIENISNNNLETSARIYLVGFDQPPPLYKDLFCALALSENSVHYFEHSIDHAVIEKVCAADKEKEYFLAASWAKQLYEKNPAKEIGIIIPSLGKDQDQVYKAFSNTFSNDSLYSRQTNTTTWTTTAGRKLADHAVIASALHIFKLYSEWVESLEFCQFIRSPFIIDADKEHFSRSELEYRIRRRSELRIQSSSLRFLCSNPEHSSYSPVLLKALTEAEKLFRKFRSRKDKPDYWAQQLELLLDLFQWQIPDSHPGCKILRKSWQQLLKDFRSLNHLSANISYPEAILNLQNLATQQSVDVFNNRAAIKILRPAEAAGLYFTNLWFCGLSDRHWPVSQAPNRFIPLQVQIKHEVPGFSRDTVVADALSTLQHFINCSSEQVVLSYPAIDQDIELQPSAMLDLFPGKIIQQDQNELPALTAFHPWVQKLQSKYLSALELHSEPASLPLNKMTVQTGGTSLIEDQAKCPFRSFAIHRLKARELPAFSVGLPATETGKILHLALELIWQELRDYENLMQMTQDKLNTMVQLASSKAVSGSVKLFPSTLSTRFEKSEINRLTSLLLEWLKKEKERSNFAVLRHEYKVNWAYSSLDLSFRIDRIDRLEDGSTAIVDYKSGKPKTLNWNEARLQNSQLLLYLLGTGNEIEFQPVSALIYAHINIESMRLKGLAENQSVHSELDVVGKNKPFIETNWEDLKQQWQQDLQALADEYIDGINRVDPINKQACQYCHLDALCRIGEHSPNE